MTMRTSNPAEWDHATGVARQVCARVFRDGGTPGDALDMFGLAHPGVDGDWRGAVERIAGALSETSQPSLRAPAMQHAA